MMSGGGEGSVNSRLAACLQLLKQAREDGTVDKICCEQFRTVVVCCSRLSPTSLLPPCLSELADTLLSLLAACRLPPDTQALASTAFCLLLSLVQEPHSTILLFSKTILPATDQIRVKLTKPQPELCLILSNPALFKLCLLHGLLQTDSIWSSEAGAPLEKLLCDKVFPLLESHCLQYSPLTLLSFKALSSWLGRARTCLPPNSFPPDLLLRLATVLVSNWENPLTGVRDLNAACFESLLGITQTEGPPLLRPSALLRLVLSEVSWMNKSKYFLLVALLPKCGVLKTLVEESEDLLYGLTRSLSYSHLAPAGTDLYRVCIETISLDQWEQTFLQPILNILTTSKYALQKQNVFNYWMPCTIKKYKMALQWVLEGLLTGGGGVDSEAALLPIICCYRLGRREGFDSMAWTGLSTSQHLLRGLKHHDTLVRAHSFAVVCVSSKTSVSPTDDEFIAVETFLTENINTDDTPLRQSILVNFTSFLCRIRDASLHILKTKYQQETQFESRALTRSMIFLEWLYNFLKGNLELGTNYQRKIASLELYKIVLNYLANENGLDGRRKGNLKGEGHRVMKYAIAVGKWSFTSDRSREILLYCVSDPANDVRLAAAHILTTYFKLADGEGPRFCQIYKKGLTLCSDMMFYNADAGALLVYVLTCLAYKNGAGPKVLEVKTERVSESVLAMAELQAAELKIDLLKATTSGSPLYGVLEALRHLLTEPSSPEYKTLGAVEMDRLSGLIEDMVHHLLHVLASKSKDISEYAPSFREMGVEIEGLIRESTVSLEESDKLHVSPAHQLLLNTIWTNLKVCCSLSSEMGLTGPSLAVLRHCSHKGAMEAAGACLGVAASHHLPTASLHLSQALERLTAGRTQSSRGAGSVILAHRLSAADVRPGKPMVEKTIGHTLSLVERRTGDLSQCLHVLTVLLKDSSLNQETAAYLHRIATASFHCLSHSSWPVRNAALQLFGAIVPKLIGQRKQTGEERRGGCSCYHLSYEELYHHARPLVSTLLEMMEGALGCSAGEGLVTHSRLVPPLTLLSNLCVGLLTILHRAPLEPVFDRLVGAFQQLMSSPINKVRELAAKANAWFCSPSQMANLIQTRIWKIVAYLNDPSLENEIKSENDLHGFLLNTKFLVNRYCEEREGIRLLREQYHTVKQSLGELRPVQNSGKISYVCRSLLRELCGYDRSVTAVRQLEEVVSVYEAPHKDLSLPQWVCVRAKQISENCPLSELLPMMNVALNSNNWEIIESCLLGLEKRVKKAEFEAVSNGAVNLLFRFISGQRHPSDLNQTLEIVLDIMTLFEINPINLNVDSLIESLLREESGGGVGVAVMCGLIRFKVDVELRLLREVVDRLETASDPNNDMDRREMAGRGLALIAPLMLLSATEDCLPVRSTLWACAVRLLQDESPTVRTHGSRFANALSSRPQAHPLNPYSSLIFLHEESTMTSLFPVKYVLKCLWSELKCTPRELSFLETGAPVASPFDNPAPNAYEETVKLVEVVGERLMSMLRKDGEVGKTLLEEEVLREGGLRELRQHCLRLMGFWEQQAILSPVLVNRHWYIVAKKLTTQSRIISQINNHPVLDKDLQMVHYRFHSFIQQSPLKYQT